MDLKEFRSRDMTTWAGSLFYCTVTNGKKRVFIIACCSGYLYVMHGVHSSGHFDRMADVCWKRYFNKAINNPVEQYEACVCTHPF